MLSNKFFIILSIVLVYSHHLHAITLVYSMRIRRVFNVGDAFPISKKSRVIATALPIYYQRNATIVTSTGGIDTHDHRKVFGSVVNARYVSQASWWVEATTAVAKERLHAQGIPTACQSRTGFDDLIFSAGYNIFPTQCIQIVPYVIGGLPLHMAVTPIEILGTLVGTRFFSAGAGLELSYGFFDTLERSLDLILQTRFLHIFNRSFMPILPCGATIQPGNVTDFLITLQYREMKDIFEAGYNPTFFTNQAVHLVGETITTNNFVRHSVYATYAHVFLKSFICEKPLILGAGFNIGRSKMFDAKIFAGWINISLIF